MIFGYDVYDAPTSTGTVTFTGTGTCSALVAARDVKWKENIKEVSAKGCYRVELIRTMSMSGQCVAMQPTGMKLEYNYQPNMTLFLQSLLQKESHWTPPAPSKPQFL